VSFQHFIDRCLPGQRTLNVKLMGGLGNQMFQYAAAKSLAEQTGRIINLDTHFFKKRKGTHTLRQLELQSFNINATVDATPAFMLKMMSRIEEENTDTPLNKCLRRGPILLKGYWQSEHYFLNIKENLREEFTLRDISAQRVKNFMQAVKSAQNSLSIHVRRGDYVTNPDAASVHGVCSLSYYQEAVKKIAEIYAVDRCFVFTDDPDWVRLNIKIDLPFDIIEPQPMAPAAEDIFMMSLCKHHVVANSSFSWWGAWLKNDDSGVTIAPQSWYLIPPPQGNNIVPCGWMRLPSNGS